MMMEEGSHTTASTVDDTNSNSKSRRPAATEPRAAMVRSPSTFSNQGALDHAEDEEADNIGLLRDTGRSVYEYKSQARCFKKVSVLAGVIASVLLLTLIIVVAQQKHAPSSSSKDISPDAVVTAARLINSIDTSADPCDNFYQSFILSVHVCALVIAPPLPSLNSSPTHVLVSAADLWPTIPKDQRVSYLTFHLISRYTAAMGKDAVYGTATAPPLWRSCVSSTDDALGFELGRLFVDEYFTAEAKQKTDSMVESIRAAFLNRLDNVKWMDKPTRAAAKDKATAVEQKIGCVDSAYATYIDALLAVFSLPAAADDIISIETQLAHIFIPNDELKDPVALYNPFTVAKLDSDFSFVRWSSFLSKIYASTTPPTALVVSTPKYFQRLTDLWPTIPKDQRVSYLTFHLISRYAAAMGKDVRALRQSLLEAYQSWRDSRDHADEDVALPGLELNSDQLFFIGFAQVWCSKFRPEEAHNRILTDVHSPAKYRVIGAVSNSQEFFDAFSCPDPKRDMCRLW
ncbi:T-cell receptor beta chain ANA 11 [Salpingoeca rosetta]|uniref:T-cell receptor beta chain ANA 11 n=1 Tax=Salpingoeca rosetta (strain ATCC 50818 / BSB-021) TaxID=946362 RepID=F2UA75_SALR5|nr:T-cell receptor beta chain ANA 11 [Salpingoeca rosetta]EGD73650.1 T-cell receptor beta chain ANA 11 [Salpingoeca rosetta]|eukprot:XP_004993931.1 T-cell receptor beta chain ANA 11 [Salpingoeca rosetta]